MAWIEVIDEERAEGELRDAYREISATRGRMPNILKIHSLRPRTMTGHWAFYRGLMFGSSELSRAERETIAVAVSVANHCHY